MYTTYKDWHVLSKKASWRSTIGERMSSPHKNEAVPLFDIPGLATDTITTDPMHSFHLGWGQDLGASGVILLCKLECFGRGALDKRLEIAYEKFVMHCQESGKTTSIDRFSKVAFDMATPSCHSIASVLYFVVAYKKYS